MQELLKEKQKADEEAEAASKNTVIKVLMGEVQVNIEIHKSYKLTLQLLKFAPDKNFTNFIFFNYFRLALQRK